MLTHYFLTNYKNYSACKIKSYRYIRIFEKQKTYIVIYHSKIMQKSPIYEEVREEIVIGNKKNLSQKQYILLLSVELIYRVNQLTRFLKPK